VGNSSSCGKLNVETDYKLASVPCKPEEEEEKPTKLQNWHFRTEKKVGKKLICKNHGEGLLGRWDSLW